MATKLAVGALGMMAQGKGAFRSLPLAGGWTQGRDLPAPEGGTFMDRYAKTKRNGGA
jgi:L-lactate dehydrogenase complex protein LldF